jgi:hypothetical protein
MKWNNDVLEFPFGSVSIVKLAGINSENKAQPIEGVGVVFNGKLITQLAPDTTLDAAKAQIDTWIKESNKIINDFYNPVETVKEPEDEKSEDEKIDVE